MKRINCFLLLLLSGCFCTLQSKASGDTISDQLTDAEQKQLELRFNYSNLFGYEIDTIINPLLYKTVAEWLGTHYHYSGDDTNGIDCSGFVSKVYKEAYGEDLAGSSRDIWHENVHSLKKKELREGDLVFFKIHRRRVSHVGVYLGKNKFAHASTKAGVVISDLDAPYYKKYFFRGGRVEK
jgi:murein DD-endopeptidase / murein LD-carboxypeptidase